VIGFCVLPHVRLLHPANTHFPTFRLDELLAVESLVQRDMEARRIVVVTVNMVLSPRLNLTT
jgi:hypothetical protein